LSLEKRASAADAQSESTSNEASGAEDLTMTPNGRGTPAPTYFTSRSPDGIAADHDFDNGVDSQEEEFTGLNPDSEASSFELEDDFFVQALEEEDEDGREIVHLNVDSDDAAMWEEMEADFEEDLRQHLGGR